MPKIALILMFSFFAFGENTLNNNILNTTKRQEFTLKKDKAIADSNVLMYDVINPLQASFDTGKSHIKAGQNLQSTSRDESFSVAVNQPIFKSGGIYYGIRYAQSNKDFGVNSVVLEEREAIKSVLNSAFRIKRIEADLKRQELLKENADIDILKKQELFDSGQGDIAELNNAIIESNRISDIILALKGENLSFNDAFESLSDIAFADFPFPKFSIISENEFIGKNIDIKQAKFESIQAKNKRNLTITTFLPTASIVASYNYQPSVSEISFGGSVFREYFTTRLQFSIPLDVNIYNTIESARLEHLIASVKLKNTENSQDKKYKNTILSLKLLDEKLILNQKNIVLYEKLNLQASERLTSGEVTQYDAKIVQNGLLIHQYDGEIIAIDKQLSLLELYIKSDI